MKSYYATSYAILTIIFIMSIMTQGFTNINLGVTGGAVMINPGAPIVELFIMTYCPYGTQAQKGILPVIELLGPNVNFTVKWVDYIMHGKTEIDENLIQECIQLEQGTKYLPYLRCFLAEGRGAECLTQVGINKAQLDSCIARIDAQFMITELFNDQSTWNGGRYPQFNVHTILNDKYQVRGSPTLVINGEQAQSSRSPQAYLTTICSYFTNPPAECSQTLSSDNPTPGFGFSGSSTTSAGSC